MSTEGKGGIGNSWPDGMAVIGMGGMIRRASASDLDAQRIDHTQQRETQWQDGKLHAVTELDAKRIDDMLMKQERRLNGYLLKEHEATIQRLHEDLALAEHRAFAAEVAARRANQKRRNQKTELKRLHAAINEKNNRIRNLESFVDTIHDLDQKILEVNDAITGS